MSWVLDSMMYSKRQGPGSWRQVPARQWDGRTNAPRRVFRKKKIKCIVAIPTRRDVEISISEEEIFSYFRHETLKIASLVLRNAHVLVFPVSTFRVVNHGISTWGRSGDVFFSLPAPKSEKTCGCSSTREWLFFFFFRGSESEIKVQGHCHLDARRPRSRHTHTPDRSIDRVDDTHSDEREREREKE